MRANAFFKSQIWGPGLFLRLKKWGQELFLASEIGGLVVFFECKIPQNLAWVPGNFWTVSYALSIASFNHIGPATNIYCY